MEGLDLEAAKHRFAQMNARLADNGSGVSVTVGVVRLRTGETIESVVARADADLYQQRQQRGGRG